MRGVSKPVRCFLNGLSAGILVYLLFDILENATGAVHQALTAATGGAGSWSRFLGLTIVYATGFSFGLLSLLWVRRLLHPPEPTRSLGPGAMAVAEATAPRKDALRLGMSIA